MLQPGAVLTLDLWALGSDTLFFRSAPLRPKRWPGKGSRSPDTALAGAFGKPKLRLLANGVQTREIRLTAEGGKLTRPEVQEHNGEDWLGTEAQDGRRRATTDH